MRIPIITSNCNIRFPLGGALVAFSAKIKATSTTALSKDRIKRALSQSGAAALVTGFDAHTRPRGTTPRTHELQSSEVLHS